MMWQKEFGANHVKNTDYILTSILIFSIIGIVFDYTIVFVVVSIFVTYFIINKIYDKTIGKKLTLKNPGTSERLFPGEKSTLTFEFDNHSLYPLINGRFQYQTGPPIKVLSYTKDTKSYYKQIDVPLSVMGRRKAVIELPIIAKQRGATRITNIKFQFPHLFNFDRVMLKYLPFYQAEFIVFPKLLPVQDLESIYHKVPGEQRMNFSPYEDIQSPAGTRDYNYSDPFHRINWKATAKTQKLQTNIYERVVDMSYIFIVNIGLTNAFHMADFNKNLEDLLSYTAYLCKETMERGFNFEVFINTRKTGRVPYLHIQEGEGKSHYINTLETLARIHQQSIVFPFKEMVYRIGQQFYKPKTIVVLGEITPEVSGMLETWKKQQQTLYQVKSTNDVNTAFIKRWAGEVMQDAK